MFPFLTLLAMTLCLDSISPRYQQLFWEEKGSTISERSWMQATPVDGSWILSNSWAMASRAAAAEGTQPTQSMNVTLRTQTRAPCHFLFFLHPYYSCSVPHWTM